MFANVSFLKELIRKTMLVELNPRRPAYRVLHQFLGLVLRNHESDLKASYQVKASYLEVT